MFGSGAVTGMILTAAVLRQILQALPLALTVCFVAVAGAAQLRTVVVLNATNTHRPTGATASVFVSPCSKFFPKEKAKEQSCIQSDLSGDGREPSQAEG